MLTYLPSNFPASLGGGGVLSSAEITGEPTGSSAAAANSLAVEPGSNTLVKALVALMLDGGSVELGGDAFSHPQGKS